MLTGRSSSLLCIQAVKGFMDMVKAQKMIDCGVRTRFVGRDKHAWDTLLHVDKQRKKLCEKVHGVSCPHGEERNSCLRSCRERLSMTGNRFPRQPQIANVRHATAFCPILATKELLECSLFLAKHFEVSDAYSTVSISPQLPPVRLVQPHPTNHTSQVSAFPPRSRVLPHRAKGRMFM